MTYTTYYVSQVNKGPPSIHREQATWEKTKTGKEKKKKIKCQEDSKLIVICLTKQD